MHLSTEGTLVRTGWLGQAIYKWIISLLSNRETLLVKPTLFLKDEQSISSSICLAEQTLYNLHPFEKK